ncbi:hypothetical protein L208DRAFT_1374189 [Tricholoma matsutake]|nr:hypothetical protein L208DRAFT_1374189 [Tricholoma matsutake 945]
MPSNTLLPFSSSRDLCNELFHEIFKHWFVSMSSDWIIDPSRYIDTLNSPEQQQWLALCMTCTTFHDILIQLPNPFQKVSIMFDTRLETYKVTLHRLHRWAKLLNSLLTTRMFKISLRLTYAWLTEYAAHSVQNTYDVFKQGRTHRALDSLDITLASGYNSTTHFPSNLPNLTRLSVKVNDDSTHGPDPRSPIIIDFPKLVYLSVKSNAPTAQRVASCRSKAAILLTLFLKVLECLANTDPCANS